jgi:hypothetical protein
VVIGLALAAIAYRQIAAMWKRLTSLKPSDMDRFQLFILLIIVTVAIWGLPYSLVPEWGFDSLNSHLPAARAYLEAGRIEFHPEINFNNFPQTVEMWFMESMTVIPRKFGTAAPLLMGICHLLTALAVFAMGRRFFSRGAGLVGALIYLLINKAFLFATLAFIDQGLTLMVVLGMYAVLRYIEKPSKALAVLAGLTLGFACGIKYSAFITVGIMGLVAIILEAFGKRNFQRLATDLLIAVGILIIICCPWYIRNWVWFHDPVFPFYSELFPAGGTYANLIPDLKVDYRSMLSMFTPPDARSPVGFLSLPYTLAFEPFGPYDKQGAGVLGPWFLMTLPLIIFLRRFPKMLWAVIATIVVTFAYWWFGEGMLHLRYMLPVYSLMAAVSGVLAWEGLRLDVLKPRTIPGWIMMAAVFGILVTFFAGTVTPEAIRAKFPLTKNERIEFMVNQTSALPVIDAMNQSLKKAGALKQARVYGFYMEQVRWYADFTLLGNQVGYADHADYLAHASSAQALHDWLKGYQVDFLIVNTPYAKMQIGDEALKADPSALPDWQQYFAPMAKGEVPIYQLK